MSTEFRFQNKRQGARVVADFRRLLETGDMAKLTPGLYHALTQHGGFIAHYDIHGFRHVYSGKLTELLAGEFYRLDDPEVWDRQHHLAESGYSDGMSAKEVMHNVAVVGENLAFRVRMREATARAQAEVATARALAAKHGLTVS